MAHSNATDPGIGSLVSNEFPERKQQKYSKRFPNGKELNCRRDRTAQILGALTQSQGLVKGDVALLEQRDIFSGNLADGYNDYKACQASSDTLNPDTYCRLRVALDRVLWKGDYTERVMIAGSDLAQMLTTSQQQSLADTGLRAPDVPGQALATFGIVQPWSPNLSRPGTGDEDFPIQQDITCGRAKRSVADPAKFCVDGQTIRSDGAYWVLTSDHLANDRVLYKVMQANKKDGYHEQVRGKFLTRAIANALLKTIPTEERSHGDPAQPETANDLTPQPPAAPPSPPRPRHREPQSPSGTIKSARSAISTLPSWLGVSWLVNPTDAISELSSFRVLPTLGQALQRFRSWTWKD